MSGKRTYNEACGIPRALDRVGERWSLLIIRELLLGPKRFTDLRTGLPHVGPDVLSQRLRDLEQAGVLVHRKLSPPAASQVYELTEWGRELESVLIALGRWGARAPAAPEGCGMSFDAHLLSLMTLFDPDLAHGFETALELRLGEERFRAIVGGDLTLERGEVEQPDAVVTGDHETLLALAHRGVTLDEAEAAGEVTVDGDRRAAERFFGLFTLPEPAEIGDPAAA
jgi:DNA-binding HxlR family transcriptional regulator